MRFSPLLKQTKRSNGNIAYQTLVKYHLKTALFGVVCHKNHFQIFRTYLQNDIQKIE